MHVTAIHARALPAGRGLAGRLAWRSPLARGAGGEAWQARGSAEGAEVFPERSETYRKMLLRLKQALDPGGIFNRGRLYSWM